MNDTFDGLEIKRVIKAKKLLVKDLADAIGVTPNTLSSALNGNRVLGKSAQKLLFRELNLKPEALMKRAS